MSEPAPLLGREAIEEAFRRLGDRLAKRGVVADIYVFGAAAMALAYDSRRATRDVDALFKPHGIVLDEAQVVGAELGSFARSEARCVPSQDWTALMRPAGRGYRRSVNRCASGVLLRHPGSAGHAAKVRCAVRHRA